MKNPGIILQLADGRKCIVYDNQPLLAESAKVLLHLIDGNNNLLKHEDGSPKVLIKSVEMYNVENQYGVNHVIGYVD